MNEKMHDALNQISDAHLNEAEHYHKRRFPWWIGAVAAILAVVIDEEGCLAAAFTVLIFGVESEPPEYEELHFTLDRPFLFVVSSRDNLPLFTGVVAQP